MGQWKTERGYGGDAMADVLGAAFKEIGELLDSEYRMIDLADAIEFCSRGFLRVEIHPNALGDMKVCDLGSQDSITIPNRGQVTDAEDRTDLKVLDLHLFRSGFSEVDNE